MRSSSRQRASAQDVRLDGKRDGCAGSKVDRSVRRVPGGRRDVRG